MYRQRKSTPSLAKTAALLFFIGLLIGDGVVAFFLIRGRLDSYFPAKLMMYFPVVNNNSPLGDPNSIAPTSIPTITETAQPAAKTYIVKSGDTILQIANDHGVSVDDLVNANHLTDKNVIRAGDELIIPSSSTVIPTVVPTGISTLIPTGLPSQTPGPGHARIFSAAIGTHLEGEPAAAN